MKESTGDCTIILSTPGSARRSFGIVTIGFDLTGR